MFQSLSFRSVTIYFYSRSDHWCFLRISHLKRKETSMNISEYMKAKIHNGSLLFTVYRLKHHLNFNRASIYKHEKPLRDPLKIYITCRLVNTIPVSDGFLKNSTVPNYLERCCFYIFGCNTLYRNTYLFNIYFVIYPFVYI